MDNGQRLPVQQFCGGYNCRHRWVAVILTHRQELEELKNKEIKWDKKDLKSDIIKHSKKLGLSPEEYEKKAIEIIKNQENPHVKYYNGVEQFAFFNKIGFVVCQKDGIIKGFYHSNNIELTLNYYLGEKLCKKIN